MALVLMNPVVPGGRCPPCLAVQSGPCPAPLWVGILVNGSNQKYTTTFLGNTMGMILCPDPRTVCGSPSAYMSIITGTSFTTIDVFKALRDGMWSSSVTIDIAYNHDPSALCRWGSFPQSAVGVVWSGQFSTMQEKTFSSTALAGSACAATHVATVTVFDDFTFTIA